MKINYSPTTSTLPGDVHPTIKDIASLVDRRRKHVWSVPPPVTIEHACKMRRMAIISLLVIVACVFINWPKTRTLKGILANARTIHVVVKTPSVELLQELSLKQNSGATIQILTAEGLQVGGLPIFKFPPNTIPTEGILIDGFDWYWLKELE